MIYDISPLPFTQRMQFREAMVRGFYVSISIDFTNLLSDTIAICDLPESATKEDFTKYKFEKIFHKEMGKQYSLAKNALKKYNQLYYERFLSNFNDISILIDYRNLFAHGFSEYHDETQDEKFISFFNWEQGKLAKYVIEVAPFLSNLQGFQMCIMDFTHLVVLLRVERDWI